MLLDVEDPVPTLRHIADCYHFLEEYKECVRTLARAVQTDPRDAAVWTNLDYALSQLNLEGLFSVFADYAHRLRTREEIDDFEIESAVDELLSRLAVEFGDGFVPSAISRRSGCGEGDG